MKNKGFTLIELIVAIAIMGILLIIAIPQVSKIQKENKTKKFETYKRSMERAAKLYTDNNSIDMFGYTTTGSYEVKLKTLQTANLMKNFQEKGVSCDVENSVVCVTKINAEEFNYASRLICKDSNGNLVEEISNNYPEGLCKGNEIYKTAPKITIASTDFNKWIKTSTEKATIKITITDKFGFLANQSVEYRFVGENSNNTTDWYTYNFNNKKILKENASLSFTIKETNIPEKTDKYTLEVRGENVNSSKNSNQRKGRGIINYFGVENIETKSAGKLYVDNEGPTIPTSSIRYDSNSGSVRTNEDTWTNRTLWWGNFNSTDPGIGSIDHYEYSENCTGEKSNNLAPQYTYNSNKNTYYCIRGVDTLGNIGEWSDPYYFRIDKDAPAVPTSVVMNLGSGIYLNELGQATTGNPKVRVSKFDISGYYTFDMEWFDFAATDSGSSGIDHFEYSSGCTEIKSNNLGNFYHYTAGTNYNFCIRSVDKAGNPSPWSGRYHFEIRGATACSTTTSDWSNYGDCSKNCGEGVKKRTRTITKTCGSKVTKLTETETKSCDNSCFNIKNASYSVCPSDQLKANAAECAANQKDKMIVELKKIDSKKINVKVTVHMNRYAQSFNNSCPTRRICLSKASDACTHELGTFSVTDGWLGLNKTKVVLNKTVNVSDYDKTSYRVVIDNKGCSNIIFRFRDYNKTNAFQVIANP